MNQIPMLCKVMRQALYVLGVRLRKQLLVRKTLVLVDNPGAMAAHNTKARLVAAQAPVDVLGGVEDFLVE